jgi:LPXTG-motif cell wall-anchored protein
VAFFTLAGAGFALIMSRYLLSSNIRVFDNNWFLGAGLLLIAGAFVVATQWR